MPDEQGNRLRRIAEHLPPESPIDRNAHAERILAVVLRAALRRVPGAGSWSRPEPESRQLAEEDE